MAGKNLIKKTRNYFHRILNDPIPAAVQKWLVYWIMKKFPVSIVLALALCRFALASVLAAEPASPAASPAFDYAKPKLLTGTLYAAHSHRGQVLYTFRRTATRSGPFVHVERRFFTTNGTLAAAEKVLYESNELVSYEMQDFQAHVCGAVKIEPDPQNPARQKIFISYGRGLHPPKGRARTLRPDTVIDDTLYPFMVAHWNELMRGKTVTFRFVSLDWERTFEFELVKTGQSAAHGRSVVQLKMKPASFFIAALVKPIFFTVQQSAPHRILSYIGRTTPRIKRGSYWKYLDAETVFDYPATHESDATPRGGHAAMHK